LEAVPVGPLLEAPQGFVDTVQRLGLHLDERELDLVLDVGFGAFGRVENALNGAPGALRADVAHPTLDLAHDLAAALLEHSLQFVVSPLVHPLPGVVMTAHMSPTPFRLSDDAPYQVAGAYAMVLPVLKPCSLAQIGSSMQLGVTVRWGFRRRVGGSRFLVMNA